MRRFTAPAAAQRVEKSLVILFDELVEIFMARSRGIGLDLDAYRDKGLVQVRRIQVGEISPGELAQTVRHAMKEMAAAQPPDLPVFLFIASHDLQEPLRKIQTFSQLVQTLQPDQMEARGFDYLKRVRRAAARMQELILSLLRYARIAHTGHPLAVTDLNAVLEEVMADLEVRLQETDARVEIGGLPAVEADPSQMRQLFGNLIENALKYRRPDVKPRIKVYADAEADGKEDADLCRMC